MKLLAWDFIIMVIRKGELDARQSPAGPGGNISLPTGPPARSLSAVTSWLGDFFRFWWSLAYWNLRKTAFRLRGRHPAECPCQHLSDSGLPYQTRCEAAAGWNRAQRFQRVCPLLVATPDGLRCSVAAENVRPFWFRAIACYGVALASLYLAGVLAVFFGLKGIGYEVGFDSVLWPTRWSEVRTAQEKLYARRAQAALAAGDFPAAVLALEMVNAINPRNLAAALALADLWQVSGRGGLADRLYERLLRDFPAQRLELAQRWYRALLARADYTRIKQLAPPLLREDERSRAAWLHALVFATRQSADPRPLRQLLAEPAGLPNWCVFVLTLEAAHQASDPRHDAALARVHPGFESPYVALYQADRLMAAGRHQDALRLLEGYGAQLPADEAGFRRLQAFQLLGWTALAAGEADTLLAFPMRPQLAAQFCAHLLRHPDRALLARFADRFVRDGPRPAPETFPYFSAVHLAAVRCGDQARGARVADLLRQQSAAGFRALDLLAATVRPHDPTARIDHLLPAVPLPTEVLYALLETHARPAAP